METPPRELTTVELLRVLVQRRELSRDYVEASMTVLAERIDGVPGSTVIDLSDSEATLASRDPAPRTPIASDGRRSSAAVRSATPASQGLAEAGASVVDAHADRAREHVRGSA